MSDRRGSELPIMLLFVAVIVALVIVVFFAMGYLIGRLVVS